MRCDSHDDSRKNEGDVCQAPPLKGKTGIHASTVPCGQPETNQAVNAKKMHEAIPEKERGVLGLDSFGQDLHKQKHANG